MHEAMARRDVRGKVARNALGGQNRCPTSRRPRCLSSRPRAHGALEYIACCGIPRGPSAPGVDDVLCLFCPSEPSAADATTGRALGRLRKWWALLLMTYGGMIVGATLLCLC